MNPSEEGQPAGTRGWCPGALRPMESGDGLIVRLRLTGGILDNALACGIARWSRQWGNGQIDLSNRANLQLRGLSSRDLPALNDAMADAGLLDDSAPAEAVRNVIASPLAGLDPTAVLDIRPTVASLERCLATDPLLHALPAKFGFSIDDGGLFSLEGVPADVRFVACPGPAFNIRLAGSPANFGPCRPEAIPEVATKIARAFLRHPGARRMRDLAAEIVARGANLTPAPEGRTRALHPCLGAHPLSPRRAGIDEAPLVPWPARPDVMAGSGGQPIAAFVGIGLPFGRIAAEDLADLAAANTQDLRLTPWRAILIPLPSLTAAHTLSARLPTNAFILDPNDPRCHIAACPGAPACIRATTHTRDDAAYLAARLSPGSGVTIHLSGCEKGCAHPGAASITLVGRNGRYDLVRDGAASAPPILRGLTPVQVAEHIR